MNTYKEDNFGSAPKARLGLSKARILIFTILIFVIFSLIYSSYFWTNQLEIKEIKITGNKYYPQKLIMDKVYSQILAHKLSSVNQDYIREIILSDPFIKSVDFITTYPEKFIISVKPKYLLAQGISGASKEYYLTDEGEMLEKGNIKLGYSLPVVDFDKIDVSKSKDNLVELSDFLKNYYSLSEKTIKAEKIWKDRTGICFQVLSQVVVRVGNLTDIENKFNKFEIYINKYLSKTNLMPNYIDLRWSNQVVTN